MSSLTPYSTTIGGLAQAVRAGAIPLREVLDFYVARTERYESALGTHLCFDRDLIWQEALALDERLKAGERDLPLAGVPILIKDNISTRGMPTTCASRMLAGYQSPYDATVVERLRQAGALIFGKANLDEFAMGSSTEHSATKPTRNPWDLTRVPGGSSGGSAAAVAADLVPGSLGSDTGGSIRQPAAFCGIVGLKPTYGRLSRYGLVAFASSLDQIGPFARNVSDVALLFDVLSGRDTRDSTSLDLPEANTQAELAKAKDLKGIRIGVVRELLGEGLQPEVRAAFEAATSAFKTLGATLIDVSLPHLPYSIATYYVIATAEASANLARYDGIRYGYRSKTPVDSVRDLYRQSRSEAFGAEVKRRIMLGTFVLSSGYYDAYYGKATKARALISRDFAQAFSQVDWLLSPTAPTTAFRSGEKLNDPLAMYLSDIGTLAANLAGIPALSLPCGFDSHGLPIGLQLMGPHLAEEKILKGAYLYEQLSPWRERHPSLA